MGALLTIYFESNTIVFGLGVFAIGLICIALGLGEAYRLASVTLAIVMLIGRTKQAWIVAAHRFVEGSDRTVRQGNIDHGNHLERNPNTTQRPTPERWRPRPGSGTSARARPNQVRKVVSIVGAGKNSRSMRPEIVVAGLLVKSRGLQP